MKRLLSFLFILLTTLSAASAKGEQDFASRFLSLYAPNYPITCKTISPQMMSRILSSEADEKNVSLLSQIKSTRLLSYEGNAAQVGDLYDKAVSLADKNSRRYKKHSGTNSHSIYIRQRGQQILEIVVVQQKENHTFSMINLTGVMSSNFLQQLQQL